MFLKNNPKKNSLKKQKNNLFLKKIPSNIKSNFILDGIMYIQRSLNQSILEASRSFPVILLTGPRQVGKTTLLKNLQKNKRSYISLDDLDKRISAEQNPKEFIDRLKRPVLIDEVQYAPNLFPYIKIAVDKAKKPGLFWLTGSQQFSMMKNVSESLAGRVAIFKLQGISLAEEEDRPLTPPFLPSVNVLKERQKTVKLISIKKLYKKIWRGSYPQLVANKKTPWQLFYESYITSYIERDVRDYLRIDNLAAFQKFIRVTAARTGQMINYREISKDVGVSEPTIKSWLHVLQATGLITIIQPYFNNRTSRLLKTPKFYFMDTGLCCFLTGWLNSDVLERGAMAGAFLETYVVTEIIKSYIHNGCSPQIFYYINKDKKEVDLLIEQTGCLYPVEIKKSTSIRNIKFRGFDFLKQLKVPIGQGCLLYPGSSFLPVKPNVDVVPISFI